MLLNLGWIIIWCDEALIWLDGGPFLENWNIYFMFTFRTLVSVWWDDDFLNPHKLAFTVYLFLQTAHKEKLASFNLAEFGLKILN